MSPNAPVAINSNSAASIATSASFTNSTQKSGWSADATSLMDNRGTAGNVLASTKFAAPGVPPSCGLNVQFSTT